MKTGEAIEIDGARGEGGGQVLRTALTLSICLQRPIVVSNIRAGRKKPGLLRQHLAAVRAAAEISSAELEGAELGASQIRFAPRGVSAGHYEFRIGSAGSTTLLLQTVLPALGLAAEPSSVTVHGGTHNGLAPSVDFVAGSLLPILARMGLRVDSSLEQHGFAPNGGGRWHVVVHPWVSPRPIELVERGALVSRRAVVKLSQLETHIAERQLKRVARKLDWSMDELELQEVFSPGPGNILSLRTEFEQVTQLFESVGALGLSAERVAGRAIRDAKAFLAGRHTVGEHLADQLLLPMVLGSGGVFTTGALSSHCRTNMALIDDMLETECFAVATEVTPQGPFTTIRIRDGLAVTR